MSRIGRKPIPLPKGVTVKIEGNTVAVQGPKGKLDTSLPAGIQVKQQDGNLVAIRESDSQAALHGLARALVNNAVEGVTKGWTRDLEIVGIGYRAELKGKGTVVFSLGYSHPIEYPLPTGIEVAVDPTSHVPQLVVTLRYSDAPAEEHAPAAVKASDDLAAVEEASMKMKGSIARGFARVGPAIERFAGRAKTTID